MLGKINKPFRITRRRPLHFRISEAAYEIGQDLFIARYADPASRLVPRYSVLVREADLDIFIDHGNLWINFYYLATVQQNRPLQNRAVLFRVTSRSCHPGGNCSGTNIGQRLAKISTIVQHCNRVALDIKVAPGRLELQFPNPNLSRCHDSATTGSYACHRIAYLNEPQHGRGYLEINDVGAINNATDYKARACVLSNGKFQQQPGV